MPAFKIAPGLVQLPISGPGYVRATSREYMTYGHPGLIKAIEEAALATCAIIATRYNRDLVHEASAVVVKDLNTADGKMAQGHKTHGKGGRNVDIGYFYGVADGSPHAENLFINHAKLDYGTDRKQGGRVLRTPHPLWHLEANWIFVFELLKNPKVVQILVDPLYLPLLEVKAVEAATPREGVALTQTPAWLARAKKVLQFWGNHDNHFHLAVEA